MRAGGVGVNRSVTGLVAAKAVSDVGFALDFVCLSVFVWVSTGSVFATGALSVVLYAGGMAGGQLGHRYGAHWDRRRVMIAADLARMAALLLLAIAPAGAQLWWLFPAVFVVGIGRSVFEATLSAATPVLAGPRAQLFNSVLAGVKGVALMAGMGLAALAVPLVGFRGVFALDALTYGLSAAAVLLLPLRFREATADPMDAAPRPTTEARTGTAPWAAVLGSGLVVLLAVRGLDALGSASHHVGLPILGELRDPSNPAGVTGTLWMAWAIGTVAGSFVLRPLVRALIDREPALVFFAATVVMSLGFIGIFWLGAWPLMLVAAAIAGLGDALSGIAFKQTVQQLPDERRGPAFGLCQTVINAGFVVGLVVTSVALSPDRLGAWVLLLHGIPMVAATAAAVRSITSIARTRTRAGVVGV
jgi:MFS family permease